MKCREALKAVKAYIILEIHLILQFMYFYCYVYVFLLYVYILSLLCMICSLYFVSLCCFVYCLCANVYLYNCHLVSTQLQLANISNIYESRGNARYNVDVTEGEGGFKISQSAP